MALVDNRNANPDRPTLALWDLLSSPRWLWHRGYPPELDDHRLWMRVLRITAVTSVLGMSSAWITAIVSLVARAVIGPQHRYLSSCEPGLIFGLIALIPLSRWQGRNWWVSGMSVVLAMLFRSLLIEWFFIPQIYHYPRWTQNVLYGVMIGGGVSVWMVPPVNWKSCGWIFLITALSIDAGFTSELVNKTLLDVVPAAPSFILDLYGLAIHANCLWPYSCWIAVLLGIRLASQTPRSALSN